MRAGTFSRGMELNTPWCNSKCCKAEFGCEHDCYLILSVRKRLGFLFTPKCLISIISVRIKYGPRPATVQPLWLHKSLLDCQRYCLSDSCNAPMTWEGGEEREREHTTREIWQSPNISTWTNVQASFNPCNHIKHTAQGPWVIFHIKGPTRCCWGFYARRTFDEFCQFSSLSTNLVWSTPFIAQLVQSVSAHSTRSKIHGPPFYIRLLPNLVS